MADSPGASKNSSTSGQAAESSGNHSRLKRKTNAKQSSSSTTVEVVPQDQPSEPEVPVVGSIAVVGTSDVQNRVTWDEGVVDNENMGKKSSKICCIYRKPWQFGHSDSEDSEDEDNQGKNAYERQPKYKKNSQHSHDHNGHSH
jgi:protein phosphatase 1 regulatory subunit 11